MSKRISLQKFIKNPNIRHKNKFDYSTTKQFIKNG